jgi:hypothetical protein
MRPNWILMTIDVKSAEVIRPYAALRQLDFSSKNAHPSTGRTGTA